MLRGAMGADTAKTKPRIGDPAVLVPEAPAAPAPQPWPTHLPRGCPGESASDCDGEVYRIIIRATGPIPKDWKSHAERCTEGCPHCKDVPPCERASLSVRTTLEAARAQFAKVNEFNRRFEGIVKAVLRGEHGKIAATGEVEHYSLWLRRSALERTTELFSIVFPEDSK